MKKPRPESLRARLMAKQVDLGGRVLTSPQFDEIEALLHAGTQYRKIVERCAELGIKTSVSSLSDFYKDLLMRRQFEKIDLAKSVASMADDGGALAKGISAVIAQKTFETVMATTDAKELAIFAALDEKAKQREFDMEKFKASIRTKLETAMDALKAEIQTKPKAMAAFEQMQEALAK